MLAGLMVVLGTALSATLPLTAPAPARHAVGNVPIGVVRSAPAPNPLDCTEAADDAPQEASYDEAHEARHASVEYVLKRLEAPSIPGEQVMCDASGCWRETPPLRATPRDDGAAHWVLVDPPGHAAQQPTIRSPRVGACPLPESQPLRRHERPPRT